MENLHKDVQKAISSGKLEGVAKSLESTTDDIQGMAKLMTAYTRAFEKEGFSETRAIKAVILLINFDSWKDD